MTDASIGPQEVLAAISSSLAAAKGISAAVTSALDRVGKNKKALDALMEAQKLATSVQSSLLDAKEQVLALQAENRQLRAEIRQKEERALDREQYERRKVGGATVAVRKDDPETFLCASCFENGKKVYLDKLSPDLRAIGTHRCPQCRSVLTAR